MTPNLVTYELALQRQAELRALAVPRRLDGDGDGLFATFLSRIRTDARRVQLGPLFGSPQPCPC